MKSPCIRCRKFVEPSQIARGWFWGEQLCDDCDWELRLDRTIDLADEIRRLQREFGRTALGMRYRLNGVSPLV